MAEFEPNRCYACKKLFCCMDCCTNHVRNKHPGRESECPLCRSEILLIRNFENSHFMCHVVINHLPLQCQSCGDLFENSADLKSLGRCSRRLIIKKRNIVDEGHSVVSHGLSTLFQTPLNPVETGERYSIEGSYNSNFDSLTSPPEFTRHTSTPMHISLSRQSTNLVFKTPRSPNFSLKTPETPNEEGKSGGSKTETPHIQKKYSSRDSNLQELLEQSESIYLSFSPSTGLNSSEKSSLKSILMSKSPMESPKCQSAELEGTSADMDLTDPQGTSPFLLAQSRKNVELSMDRVCKFPPEVKDSGKRVRFSDHFDIIAESEQISPNKSCTIDTEEFFEARQSLSEFSLIHSDIKEGNTKSSTAEALNNLSLAKYEKIRENEGNKENIKNANIEEGISGEKRENEGNTCVTTKVSETQRVVMMVLVEKSGDSGNVDLKPLIDSGLRTLESMTTNINSEKPSFPSSGESSEMKKLAVVSVDSYKSVSSIEHFHKSVSGVGNVSPDQRKKSEGGGLFSAVANAVRTAFKNISEAVSTRPVVGEPATSNQIPQSIPTIEIEAPSFVQSSSPPVRPLKRSREDLMAYGAAETDESDDSGNEIRSPEQKRHRAWYRQIRGREPIARMKNSSTRGISYATQCFQQGSLTVGDTVLPLPSRAHQSTQTDH